MKKDFLIGGLRTIVWLSLLWYVIFLTTKNIDITPNLNNDMIILSIIWFIALTMIFVGIFKPCFKKPRLIQAFMWIFLILFPVYAWIKDNPQNLVFLHDILQIIGALAVILSFGKVCVYEKCEKQAEKIKEEEMEIIEV